MKCPKCEQGTIIHIQLKVNKKMGHLCDNCETVWFREEDIHKSDGHTLKSFSLGDELSYTVKEFPKEDQEHQPVKYPTYK